MSSNACEVSKRIDFLKLAWTLERLHNKTILITGASRGIGKAISIACAAAGARVVLVARNQDDLDLTSQSVRALGKPVLALVGDVSVPGDVAQFIQTALTEFGTIDVLINNAGRQRPIGPLAEIEPEEWIRTVAVNLIGPMLCCRGVLPGMIQQRLGKIINMSGGGATAPRPNFSAYAASKAAVVRLTETLAREVQEFGIDVNAVAPGAINTAMTQEVLTAGARAGQDELLGAQRQQREGGASVDLACELVVFLSSSDSDGLTGKLISAVHDPWRQWAGHGPELSNSPMYTLRRLDPFTSANVGWEIKGPSLSPSKSS